MKRKILSPSQIIVLSFVSAILLGTILLSLPIATAGDGRLGIVDSLFTATSAVCVTGLIVKDTGEYFSGFGKAVIFFLMQIGGLGIMTFSTMFAILLGKELSISQNITVQSALDHSRIDGLKKLVLYIVFFTLTIEAIGAAALFFRWKLLYGWSSLAAFKQAAFHSVSAFCNSGFSLFSNSMTDLRGDTISMAIISALIIIGGIGFIVLLDFRKLKFLGKGGAYFLSKISLQTKIAVLVTMFLIAAGAAGFFFFERNGLLAGMSGKEKFWSCFFTSVTSRTAGFNVIQTGALRAVTLFMITTLMFIGASPGSTGGGIKTVTFGVLIAAFISMLHNKDRITLFGKTIPRQVYRRAAVIVFLSIVAVIASAFLLSATESSTSCEEHYFLNVLFEAVSAFGTVGLSTGITSSLTDLGKLIIIFTMFIGRVGPLTVTLAVAMYNEKVSYRYPEEKLMVG